jgi:spore maturation protein CgeB
MHILICGDWKYEVYELSMARALVDLGARVTPFEIAPYFKGFTGKLQSHIPFWNPATFQMHVDLMRLIKSCQPDVVLLWRCTSISPAFLRYLQRQSKVKIATYNNDDPFASLSGAVVPWRYRFLWSWYLKSTRICDLNFFYRPVNISDADVFGSNRPILCKPYFRPWRDRVLDLSEEEQRKFGGDIVFVGHFENDGRAGLVKALVDSGLRVRLFGNDYWNKGQLKGYEGKLGYVRELVGEDYIRALNGSPIALCLFSKINRDEYTRRTFEIPACGSVMLSERTPAMLEMFREDEEAVYFSSLAEAVQKAQWLKASPEVRHRISLAGQRRVHEIGGSIEGRARFVLTELGALIE